MDTLMSEETNSIKLLTTESIVTNHLSETSNLNLNESQCISTVNFEDEINHISSIESISVNKNSEERKMFNFIKYNDEYVCISENCYDEILKYFRLIGKRNYKPKLNIDVLVIYEYEQVRLIHEQGCANLYKKIDNKEPTAVQLEAIPYYKSKNKSDKELQNLAKTIATGKLRKRIRQEDPNIDKKRLKLIEPGDEEVSVEFNVLKEQQLINEYSGPYIISPNDWFVPISAQEFFPNNPKMGTKFYVFYDLWKRGYYLTDGIKFGCDYLVYDGEPGIVHSTYMCIIRHQTENLQVADTMILSRLARSVKKSILLAIPGPEKTLFMNINQWDELSCGKEPPKKCRRNKTKREVVKIAEEEIIKKRPSSYDDMIL